MKDFATSFQSLTNLTKVSSRVSAPPRNIDLIPFCLAPPPPPPPPPKKKKKLTNLKLSDPLFLSTPTPILLPLKILENLTPPPSPPPPLEMCSRPNKQRLIF